LLTETEPTTIAGAVGLLRYVGKHEDDGNSFTYESLHSKLADALEKIALAA
jgi:hypothetical protein